MNTKQKALTVTAALFIIGILIGFAIGALGLNLKTTTTLSVQTVEKTGSAKALLPSEIFMPKNVFSESIKRLETRNGIAIDAAPTEGDTQEAKVIIVEFADYQCPLCKKYFEESFIHIREKYIKTGKVLYSFRDFPLSSYPQTLLTANAANCADEQGQFWSMHDLLLIRQNDWSYNDGAREVLIGFARVLGLDVEMFTKCLDAQKYLLKIRQHIADGQRYEVKATPTIFINDKKIQGAQQYEMFTQMIEAELARPQPEATQETQQFNAETQQVGGT